MKQPRPSIVILHGWGLSSKRFDGLGGVLRKKGFTVYIPDFPGFGEAPPPPIPYTLSDYAEFLGEYIKNKRLSDVVLIGHSFGGRVSLKYSMRAPKELRAMILTGTPGFTPVPRKKLLVFIVIAKIGRLFFSVWPLNRIQEKIRLWYYYLVGAREFYRAEGVMRETFKRIVQEDLRKPMESVRVPCLLVWGSLDHITPVWIAKKMTEMIQGSTLIIIPDHDHGVPFKDPKLFAAKIDSFLTHV